MSGRCDEAEVEQTDAAVSRRDETGTVGKKQTDAFRSPLNKTSSYCFNLKLPKLNRVNDVMEVYVCVVLSDVCIVYKPNAN